MSREHEYREAYETVRRWLEGQGAQFLQEARVGSGRFVPGFSARFDFLVVSPFPFALEVVGETSPNSRTMRQKRELAFRIVLADRFGPSLPFVVVSTYSDPAPRRHAWSVADAQLSLTALPDFDVLRTEIALREDVQHLLRAGEPTIVQVTEPEDLITLWSEALTLQDLIDLPPSLVNSLASAVAAAIHDEHERVSDSAGPQRSRLSYQGGSDHLMRSSMGSRAIRAIEDCVALEVERRLGGKFRRHRIPMLADDPMSTVVVPTWHMPDGRVVVIRTGTVGPATAWHKARELLADAWATRSTYGERSPELVLLLGPVGERTEVRTIAGIPGARSQQWRGSPEWFRTVNLFEAAGWRVFPWDFAAQEPAFLRFLRLPQRQQ